MGKYTFGFSEGMYRYISKQTISIDIKESKVRLIISDPYFKTIGDALNGTYHGVRSYTPLETEAGIGHARKEWVELAKSLEESLKESSNW